MKEIIIAVSFSTKIELSAGDVVTLTADPKNEYDPNAVKVSQDGSPIGWVANSEKTLKPGYNSATWVSSMLAKKSVAGAVAKLKSTYLHPTAKGDPQVMWTAEVFWLPVWESVEDQPQKSVTLTVSGRPLAHEALLPVIKNIDKIESLSLGLNKETGVVSVWYAPPGGAEASAGNVNNPPQQLLEALNGGRIPCRPVQALSTNSYTVDVLVGKSACAFRQEMEPLIRSCIMQVRDLKERVSYLIAQGVPDPLIRALLGRIASGSAERPSQLFEQGGDRALTRAIGYYLANRNIRLVGEKGTGKNTLIATVGWLFNQPVVRVQGSSEMDKIDLLGGQSLKEGRTEFELSQFITALRDGLDVVLDEINAIRPEVGVALHSILDCARGINIPGLGWVDVSPKAHIWATMNEAYVGTGELNAATADRFTAIRLESANDFGSLLKKAVPSASEENVQICVSVAAQVRQAVKDGRCSMDSITVRGYIDALESTRWLPIRDALVDNVANRTQDPDDRAAITEFIGALCP